MKKSLIAALVAAIILPVLSGCVLSDVDQALLKCQNLPTRAEQDACSAKVNAEVQTKFEKRND